MYSWALDILPCSASCEVDNTDEELTVNQYPFNQPSTGVLLWHSILVLRVQ